MQNFNSLTEIAIYLADSHRGDEYNQIQHQLNHELNEGVFKIKERGAASITVELKDGEITVKHGTDTWATLAKWTANAGDWEKIWATINELKASA